jgi:integrase
MDYWDQTLTGFGVRLSQGGTRSFFLIHGANRHRITIGRYPIISLSDARREAKRLLAEFTLGKTRSVPITFEDAKNRFLEESEQRNRPRTTKDYQRLLDRHFRFDKTSLSEITQHGIMTRIDRLGDTPSEQNHAFVTARVFFRWAARHRYIDRSPLEGLALPAASRPRDRILTDAELGAVYRHARAYPYPYGPIVSLLILTGQRRGEIAALKWNWINREEKSIALPSEATRNGRAHVFPYGATVAKILDRLPEIGDHLFPATRAHVRGQPTTIFNGWSKGKVAFDKALRIEPYTLHDLRRTFSSGLAALAAPIHVTEKLLNHASGTRSGVAGIYDRHSHIDELRDALDRWEDHIHAIPNPR